jgi:ferric-dicitrate binding protein FerR (iron transport regulator)
VSFGAGERRVFLEGEACFEVPTVGDRAFVVVAGGAEVRVLGTVFAVEAYGGASGDVVATLVSGSVRVVAGDGAREAVLHPDEQAVVTREGIVTRAVDASRVVAWTRGRFCFDGVTLEEIARRLERWYDVVFVFEEEELSGRVFTGMVTRDQSLDDVFSIFERATRLRFTREGETVRVGR